MLTRDWRPPGAGLLRFHEFCDDEGITEEDRVPASEVLLCGFAAVAALDLKQSTTLSSWMAGLRAWHLAQGAPWVGGSSERLAMVKKAVAKRAPESSKRPLRSPVTVKHMAELMHSLRDTNTQDIAIRAAVCIAFWGIMRLGEVVPPKAADFNAVHHVSKAASVSTDVTRGGIPFLKLSIPWTKTTKHDGAVIVLNPRPGDPSCPVKALQRHLQVNGTGRGDLPLFAFRSDKPEGFETLSKTMLMDECNVVWRRAGLGTLTGHSFRIGGATEMLLQGLSPNVVQKMGRWKSDAFMAYWRSLDEVIPTFASAGISDRQLAELRSKMERWFGNRVELVE